MAKAPTLPRIRRIVEGRDTRLGRSFDLTIQGLIVVSIVSFSIETLPGLSPASIALLDAIEWATVALFTVEYLLRLAVAPRRLGFVFSFYGLVDLLAILPTYLSTGIDFRAIRALRLMRLFRIVKLARYSKALNRFSRALAIAREELVLFFSVAILLFFVAAVGIYQFEHVAQPEAFASVFHSLWWAVATLTTVGYGDVYPVTVGGKVFTFVVLMMGLGLVAVPSGLLAASLSQARREEMERSVDS